LSFDEAASKPDQNNRKLGKDVNRSGRQNFTRVINAPLNRVRLAGPDAPQAVGDPVPENIELHPIPPEVAAKVPQVKSHSFFVKNDDTIILVSPSDRRVADVIKKSNG
jgi:hypothetical protein